MDAPDIDELEWMAQQQFDALQDPSEFLQEEDETAGDPFCHSSSPRHREISSPIVPDAGRKRSLSAEPEIECKSNHVNAKKRGKMDGDETIEPLLNCNTVENDWVLAEEADWSPGPSTDTKSADDAPKNANCKLPVRRLADIEGNFMPITGPLGDRVYAEVNEVQMVCNNLQRAHSASKKSKHGLLSESFEDLLEQVESNLLKQACRIAEEQDAIEDFMTGSAVHEPLWVEKYAPKSFTELLSDEQTNREVLRWLKQWDKCVFGEKKTCTSLDVLAALKRHAPTYQNRRALDKKGMYANGSLGGSENDPSGGERYDKSLNHSFNSMGSISSNKTEPNSDRPEEKILLLCGPPGLGKTTLAHVAARHCGYRVVEINASDDRVATTLQAKILDAVQMKSVMGDLRPNCVVIDEIDGALGGADGKGAIDALLKIAYAGAKDFSGKENEKDGELGKQTLKKKASTTAALSRPVICICNDPYAPALRQLRQMAKVHVFSQPSVNRVVTRLKYICGFEGYKINARALTALADHTECDIRSCLNTLQFLRKRKETLNTLDIASQVVGRKDMTRSAFDIWGEILQKRKSKHGAYSGQSTSFGKFGQEVKEFLRLHDLLANHGDFELTNDGVYDNLSHVRYHDSSLDKTVECLELLGDSEITSHHALRHQMFSLNVYQPSFALAIRRLIAQPDKPYLEWPKTFQRFRVELSAKQELLRSWMMSMQPTTHRSFTSECLAWDLVSSLLCILAPQRLRPLAPQLLSHIEKEEMNQLVDTMIAYGINYKISKLGTSYGDNSIEVHGPVLDPPIHKLVQFKEYKPERYVLSSTLRQVLSHEVELEIIRRESLARTARAMSVTSELQELSLGEGLQNKKDIMIPTKPEELKQTAMTYNSTHSSVDNSRERRTGQPALSAKPVAKAPKKPAIDAFARFRVASATSGKAEKNLKASSALAQRDSRPIFFKFNEGFTNAIRRPVLVRDLI